MLFNVVRTQFLRFTFLLILFPAVAQAQQFRPLLQENLWYLHLDTGLVIIELNERFAPRTTERIRSLSGAGFFNGKGFYRVIDGFVAQAGANADTGVTPLRLEPNVRLTQRDPLTLVQSPDMFAPVTAFWQGFAVGMTADQRTGWLLHCPGAVGMSRANTADSATSDFYIVIGQAPRYLDNLMTVFGRVVWGMDRVQQIRRAAPESSGMIADASAQTRIRWAAIGSSLPADQRVALAVEDTANPEFVEKLKLRRERPEDFFFQKPPPVLDACQVPLAVKRL